MPFRHHPGVDMRVGDEDADGCEYLSKYWYYHDYPVDHLHNDGYKDYLEYGFLIGYLDHDPFQTTTSITLTRRGMSTPTRCVRRPEEEKRNRELVKRADPTFYVTLTITVTETPAYMTSTWLSTYWITSEATTTRISHLGVVKTVTSTTVTTTTTSATATATISPGGLTAPEKVGAGIGGTVGGLAVIALAVVLIWRKYVKPTAQEEWAGNQPVEDRTASHTQLGAGMAMAGAGGMKTGAGMTGNKGYQQPNKVGHYDQNGNLVMTDSSSSPSPLPAAYSQSRQSGFRAYRPPTPDSGISGATKLSRVCWGWERLDDNMNRLWRNDIA
ncbi:hypothetical protein L873DRAFT_1843462 [Choiromyces venosus 120613-1]|uniref:Mid2 domain-containing protein n=1 Tax=Choiromyces venosus 120613-1 TaxID=1336337 RepID=A0A3N4JMS3_9PEZI|nr:hypothetical protein L873DRAFT_1843462 [Choiromyces venosus 120613-1]